MAFNIMDLITDQLSDSIKDQLGGILGENADVTQSAIAGAIPAILTGLMGTATDDEGATKVFNTIKDEDDSFLDSLGDILGGNQSNSMIEVGGKMVSNLLGDSGLGSIVGALAAFSGMGRKPSNSLVSILAPIIIGVVKRKLFSGEGGGTIDALTSLFTEQKDNITQAMPSGMKDQLDTSGFFDRLDAAVESGGEAVEQVQETVSEVASGGSSMMRKLVPILIIAAVAWFAMNMMKDKEAPMQPDTQIEMSGEAVDYGSQIGSIFSETTNTFSQITDVESATEQLPNLKSVVTEFEGFSGTFSGLPEAVRAPVIVLAKDAFSELQPVIDNVLEIPGVGDVIKPTSDALLEQLNQLIQ